MITDDKHPLFKVYCEDTSAGDWHRPFDNDVAGYRQGAKDISNNKRIDHVVWSHLNELRAMTDEIARLRTELYIVRLEKTNLLIQMSEQR